MTGMPCCFPVCTLGDLPVLSISGMHVSSAWTLLADCCAQIEFEFDTLQPVVKLDGGDVYTADQTVVTIRDAVYYPLTCAQIVEAVIDESGESGPMFVTPTEPAYTGCCSDKVVMNTITCTWRHRVGQRFLVCVRPIKRIVTIQKALITCDSVSTERFLITSKTIYEGNYTYFNWELVEQTYSQLHSDPSCWKIPTDTSSGALFDFATWNCTASGTAGPWEYVGGGVLVPTSATVCKQLVRDAMPSAEDLVFALDSCLAGYGYSSDCELDVLSCVSCDCDAPCWDSGETGASAPNDTFCDPTTFVTQSVTTYRKTCLQHFWKYPPAYGGACFLFGSPHSFPDVTTTVWNDIEPCLDMYSWLQITNVTGASCICPSPAVSATNSCWVSYVCPACPSGTYTGYYPPDSPSGTYNVVGNGFRCVPHDITRSIVCSGYVRRLVCLPFTSWSVVAA